MKNKELATKYFDSLCETNHLEEQLINATCKCIGVNLDNASTWFFKNIIFDYYDASFELIGAKPLANDKRFKPTNAQLKTLKSMGFARFWVVYHDKDTKNVEKDEDYFVCE